MLSFEQFILNIERCSENQIFQTQQRMDYMKYQKVHYLCNSGCLSNFIQFQMNKVLMQQTYFHDYLVIMIQQLESGIKNMLNLVISLKREELNLFY
ncbi:unnamed protein product [Paramecium primaurelia]|uniref:Uncharacterized protein n=1 Tax=Paramecium primaurelia TaxID=5886 RepID=A0A8S1LEI8_PARPR|nr:unnamed protein product [Paramecium primaurelia]